MQPILVKYQKDSPNSPKTHYSNEKKSERKRKCVFRRKQNENRALEDDLCTPPKKKRSDSKINGLFFFFESLLLVVSGAPITSFSLILHVFRLVLAPVNILHYQNELMSQVSQNPFLFISV